jgi:hypothetical protein
MGFLSGSLLRVTHGSFGFCGLGSGRIVAILDFSFPDAMASHGIVFSTSAQYLYENVLP